MDKNLIMLEAKKELARREFFYFCHLSAPSFYKTDRKFLVRLCNEMQSFYESDEDALIINLPQVHLILLQVLQLHTLYQNCNVGKINRLSFHF